MSISLKSAMQIHPFSKAKLIGGETGISRRVRTANIQEVPYVHKWLEGGEILFTSGYAFKNVHNGCKMMRRLNEVGIAALVIKPGQYLPKVPQEMVDLSNEIGLPLFELPQDLPYMDCIITILEHITQKHLESMKRIDEMLKETMLNREGLDGICNILNLVMASPVFVTSPEGTIYSCKDKNNNQNYLDLMKIKLEDCISSKLKNRFKKKQCNIVNLDVNTKLILVPIYVKSQHLAYLILDISDKESKLGDGEMLIFEQSGSMVALELLNIQVTEQRKKDIRKQLLDDLLMGRYSDEEMVIQRGQYVEIDLTSDYFLFVIDADSFEEALKTKMLGLSEEEIQRIKIKVQDIIHKHMRSYHRPSLILDSSVGVVGMISVRCKSDMDQFTSLIDIIVQDLEKNINCLTFSAGISRVKHKLQDIKQAHQESHLAMSAGREMKHNKELPHSHTFEDLGCLTFLYELSDSKAMKSFYKEYMDVIFNYDKENNSELVKTLEAYFECNQNLRKTSEALFIHRNSVIYRIDKIESLLNKSLNNPRVLFDLQLCFRLRRLILS